MSRRNSYEAKVAEFIQSKGPEFTLLAITHEEDGTNCECCGKPNIHNLYHIQSCKGAKYVVGSECQQYCLVVTEAHVPASRVRNMDLVSLVKLGAKYGVMITNSAPTDAELLQLAEQVIAARRSLANKTGYANRKQEEPQQLMLTV